MLHCIQDKQMLKIIYMHMYISTNTHTKTDQYVIKRKIKYLFQRKGFLYEL